MHHWYTVISMHHWYTVISMHYWYTVISMHHWYTVISMHHWYTVNSSLGTNHLTCHCWVRVAGWPSRCVAMWVGRRRGVRRLGA